MGSVGRRGGISRNWLLESFVQMLAEHVLCPLASISLMVHLYLCYAVRWASAEDAHFFCPRRQQLLIPELRSARRVGEKGRPKSPCRRVCRRAFCPISAEVLGTPAWRQRGLSLLLAADCRSQSAESSRV